MLSDINIGLIALKQAGLPKATGTLNKLIAAFKEAGGQDPCILMVAIDVVRRGAWDGKSVEDAKSFLRLSQWASYYE